MTPPEAESSLA